ncbi:MAG TPA: nitroreductase family deazaflavin-dependent oxidoreductase [Actinopolymorphaceae bacterium]
MAGHTFPPRSLKIFNRALIWAQRRGLTLGTIHVLTVPGRKSGKPRSTPVSPFEVDGHDYIVGGYGIGDWVKNVRAAGKGVLARGRHSRDVELVELPESARGRILREFPVKVPHGVSMFLKTGVVANETPEAFEAAAPNVAVFRIEPL